MKKKQATVSQLATGLVIGSTALRASAERGHHVEYLRLRSLIRNIT